MGQPTPYNPRCMKILIVILLLLLILGRNSRNYNDTVLKFISNSEYDIILVGRNEYSGRHANSKISKQYVLVYCRDSSDPSYREEFWPGPDWNVINDQKIKITTYGIQILGPKKTLTIPTQRLAYCHPK